MKHFEVQVVLHCYDSRWLVDMLHPDQCHLAAVAVVVAVCAAARWHRAVAAVSAVDYAAAVRWSQAAAVAAALVAAAAPAAG